MAIISLPSCGRPATDSFELYTPGFRSLAFTVHLCARHADLGEAANAAGLMPFRVAASAVPHRCGDGFDFTASR